MKIRKPIEGLLGGKVPQRWWWLAAPVVIVVALIVNVVVVSHALTADDEEGAVSAAASESVSAASDSPEAAGAEEANGSPPPAAAEADPSPEGAAAEEEEEASEPLEEEAPPADAKAEPGKAGRLAGTLESGQTVFTALVDRDLTAGEVQSAINSLSQVFDFRKSRPGDSWEVRYDASHKVTSLIYQPNPEVRYVAAWDEKAGKYASEKKEVPLEVKVVGVGGTVKGTLYKALLDLGEKSRLISGFIDRFAYDVNFASDTKPGDTFRILVEKIYLDGEFLRYGHILAAEYVNKGKALRIYRFEDGESASYHDAKGSSLKRMFLRNPVKFSRISSRFGKRFHPVLKKHKMHNGVDYAAPTGTPVHAIANGTVTFAGRKGANGNLVAIRHPNGWTSYYAHLSKFGKDGKSGQKVSQGDVIGYVGSTGRSTGPHLHLGIKGPSGFIDPLSVHSTRGASLSGARLAKFKAQVKELDRKLDRVKIQPPSDGPDEPEIEGGDDNGALEEEDVDAP